MNENLNLVEILKDCPKGTKLYCTLCGEVIFNGIDKSSYTINVNNGDSEISLTKDGKFWSDSLRGECLLFPSKNQRDWSKFKVKNLKFDPKTLNPFDRVLARIGEGDAYVWCADFISTPTTDSYMSLCTLGVKDAFMIIPYNEETKHLVGTSDDAPEFYRYWEE